MLLAAPAAVLHAQSGNVIVSGSLRTRVEAWDWFKGDADGDYVYSGSLVRLGVSRSTPKRDWRIEFAAPVLLGLPDNAIAPGAQGQQGLGATYFAANGGTHAAALFVKQASLRFKELGGHSGSSLAIGRIEFTEGAEVTPDNATLAAVKRDRIAQRLVGNFGFTHVGRSFDGIEWVGNRNNLNVTAFGGRPTKGVFQVDGWGELDVNLFYGAVTAQQSEATEWRVFGVWYDDYRDGVVKTDNRAAAVRRADSANVVRAIYPRGAHGRFSYVELVVRF